MIVDEDAKGSIFTLPMTSDIKIARTATITYSNFNNLNTRNRHTQQQTETGEISGGLLTSIHMDDCDSEQTGQTETDRDGGTH